MEKVKMLVLDNYHLLDMEEKRKPLAISDFFQYS